ncbi:type I-E CRISPR-associated protein Cas6/Cse3/CasE, partial [Nocardia neocaledoniensis]
MSLWLTRIQLDLRDYAVRRDLASAVQLHRTMMSMMPAGLGDNPRSRSGLLFRVEETRTATSLLVQSRYQPDVTRLPSGYRDAMTKSLDGLLGGLANATRVRFRIVGNPTKRTPRGHENPGKVVALRGADVEQWWIRRARDSGLIVSAVVATQLSDISERR